MIATVLLSIVPMLAILLGAIEAVRRSRGSEASPEVDSGGGAGRPALLISLASIGIYLAAMLDLFMHLPIMSTGKATYMLGLLPCFAILAAQPGLIACCGRAGFGRSSSVGWRAGRQVHARTSCSDVQTQPHASNSTSRSEILTVPFPSRSAGHVLGPGSRTPQASMSSSRSATSTSPSLSKSAAYPPPERSRWPR